MQFVRQIVDAVDGVLDELADRFDGAVQAGPCHHHRMTEHQQRRDGTCRQQRSDPVPHRALLREPPRGPDAEPAREVVPPHTGLVLREDVAGLVAVREVGVHAVDGRHVRGAARVGPGAVGDSVGAGSCSQRFFDASSAVVAQSKPHALLADAVPHAFRSSAQ